MVDAISTIEKLNDIFGTKAENSQPLSLNDMEQSNIWITDFDDYKGQFPVLGIHINKIKISQEDIIRLTGNSMSWEDEPVEI